MIKPWNKIKFTKRQIEVMILIALALLCVLTIRRSDWDFSGITARNIRSYINSYGVWAPVVFVLFYQIRIFLMIPVSLLSTMAGVMWGWMGLIYTLIALTLCLIWEFLFAHHLARNTVKEMLSGRFEGVAGVVRRRPFTAVLVLRLVPNVVLDLQNVFLALTSIDFRTYLTASLIGLLPGQIVLVFLGDSFFTVLAESKVVWPLALAVACLLLLFVLSMYLKRQLNKHPEEGVS